MAFVHLARPDVAEPNFISAWSLGEQSTSHVAVVHVHFFNFIVMDTLRDGSRLLTLLFARFMIYPSALTVVALININRRLLLLDCIYVLGLKFKIQILLQLWLLL